MLSVLQFTDSDYPFSIFNLSLNILKYFLWVLGTLSNIVFKTVISTNMTILVLSPIVFKYLTLNEFVLRLPLPFRETTLATGWTNFEDELWSVRFNHEENCQGWQYHHQCSKPCHICRRFKESYISVRRRRCYRCGGRLYHKRNYHVNPVISNVISFHSYCYCCPSNGVVDWLQYIHATGSIDPKRVRIITISYFVGNDSLKKQKNHKNI